ncbi:hypothetical protein [Streptacidiphilus jeojiense]|uniref:hypothetical protein n=1 Tax=Streptacidiphilus jeojiense TaxID=436229 RepID=UPI001E518C10|nr:hypothetical protein [Streptacidiphilus jeojiense]
MTTVGGASSCWDQRQPARKVVSWLASSMIRISLIRGRKSTGIRLRVFSSVDSAL